MSAKTLRNLTAVIREGHVCLRAYRASSFDVVAADEVQLHVYRHHAPTFRFNEDGPEFFDGLHWQDAEIIHQGPAEEIHGSQFVWTDTSVRCGQTYAYWLATGNSEPIGPAAVKSRDPDVWWSMDRLSQELDDLQRDYPDRVKVECIGRSALGRDISAVTVGHAETSVGMIGAIHAGEAGAELIVPLIRMLIEQRSDLLSEVGMVAIPVLNVDHRERMAKGTPWYLRTNAHGVDLNRNFPGDWDEVSHLYGLNSARPDSVTYRGPYIASEPETRAAIDFLTTQSPSVVFSLHCLAGIAGARMLPAAAGKDDADYVARCRSYAMPYAQGMLPDADFDWAEVLSFGTTAGSVPTWLYQRGVPAFDLEILAEHEADALTACQADTTTVQLLNEYQRRHFHGLVAAMKVVAGERDEAGLCHS